MFVQDYFKNKLRNNIFYRIKKKVLKIFGKKPKKEVNEFFTKDISEINKFSNEYFAVIGYVLELREFIKDIIKEGTAEGIAEILKKMK